jgi:hypothetical protein
MEKLGTGDSCLQQHVLLLNGTDIVYMGVILQNVAKMRMHEVLVLEFRQSAELQAETGY